MNKVPAMATTATIPADDPRLDAPLFVIGLGLVAGGVMGDPVGGGDATAVVPPDGTEMTTLEDNGYGADDAALELGRAPVLAMGKGAPVVATVEEE